MMTKYSGIALFLFFFNAESTAEQLTLKSEIGNSVAFVDKFYGENIDQHAWRKIYFLKGNYRQNLSRDDRYYTEDGSSTLSPSGEYLKVNSISGDYVSLDDGSKKYTDRAYCSIIDMKDGCIVSDWDGEACAYDWEKNKDVLSQYPDGSGEKFDFESFRPKMKFVDDLTSAYTSYEINNLIRCDAPDRNNINIYQAFMDANSVSKKIVSAALLNYLNSLSETLTLRKKTPVYASPSENAKKRAT